MGLFRNLLANFAGGSAPWPEDAPDLRFRKGDVIGGLDQIFGLLGQGGFGLVLLVHDRNTNQVCALKTFRDEFLADAQSREIFKREASHWVDLGEHPFVLAARLVLEFSNRLFVKMDFVAPDHEGRASLADFLVAGSHRPISAAQTLEWAIQFCLGMEHANQRGIKCHRDIKPQNILVCDGNVKIADFGLALAAEAAAPARNGESTLHKNGDHDSQAHFSVVSLKDRNICGTPGYIPPEIFRGEPADVRSDIYSFGLVLWQMAAMSPVPPFANHNYKELEAYLKAVYDAQMKEFVPQIEGPIYAVIEKCLCCNPADRYANFADLRAALEPLLLALTGKTVDVVFATDKSSDAMRRGISLCSIGRNAEAIAVFDEALAAAPAGTELMADFKADLLLRKGACYIGLGQMAEAIPIFDAAIAANSQSSQAYFNKGVALDHLGEAAQALACYEAALRIRPNYFKALDSKSRSLYLMNRLDEALACSDEALRLNPKEADAWVGKGAILGKLGKSNEAIACFNRCLAIDPRHTTAMVNKAYQYSGQTRYTEAIACCDECIKVDPKRALAWIEKGRNLFLLQRDPEAKGCYDQGVALDPKHAPAWSGKGHVEEALGNLKEALRCFCMFVDLAGTQQASRIPEMLKKIRELEQRVR